MQFITNGPNIPEALLQAHEEGRVVFFCGAGISYPAGLPGFKKLVEEIYLKLGTQRDELEDVTFGKEQYDATLNLLESRIPGGRLEMRKALAAVLEPDLQLPGATETHEALLDLATTRDDVLRLITTNFDRVFEEVSLQKNRTFTTYAAPLLPIPKDSRWDGLVYLHGQLTNINHERELNRLVATSGDFGLAYLTERWASRFVGDLFRNYIVCFIGYSINDPILRYMMDALAADRMLGQLTPHAYALGDAEPGQEPLKTKEWMAKGVTPILYSKPLNTHDHSILHLTLKAWAESYRNRTDEKERIVEKYGLSKPSDSTKEDDYVGRMLWALSDKSGLPAKSFASLNPAPRLEWLEVFEEMRFTDKDLARFGVVNSDKNQSLKFSLVNRPAPYKLSQWMSFTTRMSNGHWDDVMEYLARWLVRYLNDPNLILWLANHGPLHERLIFLVESELTKIFKLEREENSVQLIEIEMFSPNAIPSYLLKPLWGLLLSGKIETTSRDGNLFSWIEYFKRDGFTTRLRHQLRNILEPKVTLRKPFKWPAQNTNTLPTKTKDLVDWQIVLPDSLASALAELNNDTWVNVLSAMLDDFQLLLLDALNLMRELGGANDFDDMSCWDMPSIVPHHQNQHFNNWVILIELLRDAWLSSFSRNEEKATAVAIQWFNINYPVFKRLAFFAASHKNIVNDKWVDWLLSDNWLWNWNTKREVMRLLASQSQNLSEENFNKLIAAILNGPSRESYPEDISENDWQSHVEYQIWLRIEKIKSSGVQFTYFLLNKYSYLSVRNPKFKLDGNEREEFSHWMSGTGDLDYEEKHEVNYAPITKEELMDWLIKPINDFHRRDNWNEVCVSKFYESHSALKDLACQNKWPYSRWADALQMWSNNEEFLTQSWNQIANILLQMPNDDEISKIAYAISWWLEAVSKADFQNEKLFIDLCKKILKLPLHSGVSATTVDGKPISRPVVDAINHPVGHIINGLLNVWFKHKPNDNDKLPLKFKSIFESICDPSIDNYRHGRVILASRLISMFRIDNEWTDKNLIPLFDWCDEIEACSMWSGFLSVQRSYPPLQIKLKPQLLETSLHYFDLGDARRLYVDFITHLALFESDGFVATDFQLAIENLPIEGKREVINSLVHILENSGDKKEEYWSKYVLPFWSSVWPKQSNLIEKKISEPIIRLCLSVGNKFPDAYDLFKHWMVKIDQPHFFVHRLLKSGNCVLFPSASLSMLNSLFDEDSWAHELSECLNKIAVSEPSLIDTTAYKRLLVIVRRTRM